jgi:hypothetical protein
MAGKLDDISVSIGSLLAKVENLGASIAANRSEADRRHQENTDRLNRIDEVLKPVAAAVANMERSSTTTGPTATRRSACCLASPASPACSDSSRPSSGRCCSGNNVASMWHVSCY